MASPKKTSPKKASPKKASPTKVKKAKKEKAPKAKKEKQPAKGYMLFVKKNRDAVLKANPGIKFGDVGKKLGEMWRALSATEKAKY